VSLSLPDSSMICADLSSITSSFSSADLDVLVRSLISFSVFCLNASDLNKTSQMQKRKGPIFKTKRHLICD
jgi:hypothetical protein